MAKPIDCPQKSDHILKTEDGNPKFRLHANNHRQSETEDGNLAKIMIEAQNLRGLEDPDTHICGFMAAK